MRNILVLASLACCGCGSSPTSSEKIVGGESVKGSDPVVATTVAVYADGGTCTGSLIADDIVVTAAHCVDEVRVKSISIFFGLKMKQAAATRDAIAYAQHPNYATRHDADKDTGDIALIRFSGGMPKGFQAADLLSAPLKNDEAVELAGYGITDAIEDVGAGTLRKVNVKVMQANFSSTEVLLDQSQGRGACHGDSGGPAFVADGSKLLLWGLTNRGYPDNAVDDCKHQSVYTRISAYSSWIQESVKKLHDIAGK